MNVTEFLNKLPTAINSDAVAGMDCTIQLNISAPTYLKVSDGSCTVHEGTADAPDVSLTVSDANLIALLTGKLSGITAYMTGKLQLDGDLMLAKEISSFFDSAKLA